MLLKFDLIMCSRRSLIVIDVMLLRKTPSRFVLGRAEFGSESAKFNKGEKSAILKLRS